VEVRPGGNRRIDRVLAEDYLDDLGTRSLPSIRSLREEADQEETDLSYLRRLLQGRIDLVIAEQRRRAGTDNSPADLPHILGEPKRGPAHGLGRHLVAEPSNVGLERRAEEKVANLDVTNLRALADDELEQLLVRLRAKESEISAVRRRVQAVFDAASAEIARRYRDGEASVSDLLAPEGRAPAS
jgi:hypothetical protein